MATEYSNRNGQFSVPNVRQTDKISIIASKALYNTNSTKEKDNAIAQLSTQDSRIIPLKKKETFLRISMGLPNCSCRFNVMIEDPCGKRITPANYASADCRGNRPTSFSFSNASGVSCYWPAATPGQYKITIQEYEDYHSGPIDFSVIIDDHLGSGRRNNHQMPNGVGIIKTVVYDLLP